MFGCAFTVEAEQGIDAILTSFFIKPCKHINEQIARVSSEPLTFIVFDARRPGSRMAQEFSDKHDQGPLHPWHACPELFYGDVCDTGTRRQKGEEQEVQLIIPPKDPDERAGNDVAIQLRETSCGARDDSGVNIVQGSEQLVLHFPRDAMGKSVSIGDLDQRMKRSTPHRSRERLPAMIQCRGNRRIARRGKRFEQNGQQVDSGRL
jgi:hypothetical protein